jgi:hypothetical protein
MLKHSTARCIGASAATISSATPPTRKKRLVKRLSELGYAVELKPVVA